MNSFINCLNDFRRRIECIQCGCTGGCKFRRCHHLFCLFIFAVPRCVVRIKRFRNSTESGIRTQHHEFLLSGLPTIPIQIVDNLHGSEIPLKNRTFPCCRFHVRRKVNLRKIDGISITCFLCIFFHCRSNVRCAHSARFRCCSHVKDILLRRRFFRCFLLLCHTCRQIVIARGCNGFFCFCFDCGRYTFLPNLCGGNICPRPQNIVIGTPGQFCKLRKECLPHIAAVDSRVEI